MPQFLAWWSFRNATGVGVILSVEEMSILDLSPMRLLSSRHCSALVSTALAVGRSSVSVPSASALSFSLGPVGTPVISRCEPNIIPVVPGGANSVAGLSDNLPISGYTADLGAHLAQFG